MSKQIQMTKIQNDNSKFKLKNEKEKLRNAIVQQDPLGCGVACIAYTLNLSYKEALDFLENGPEKAKRVGFLCKGLIKALDSVGRKYEYRYINKKMRRKIYREGTVVFIKRSRKYPNGHYLCRTKNSWMDPWINWSYHKNIKGARAGFRKRAPGKPVYAILPIDIK